MGQRVYEKAWFYTRRGNRKRLRRLIAKRPDLRTSDESCLLLNAIWHNRNLVPWLLARGVSPDCRLGIGSNTPLMQAASENDIDLMLLLLRCGADVMATNEANERPLGFACALNQPDAARILLEHGADPNLPEDVNSTYLDWAIVGGHTELVAMLKSRAAVRYVHLPQNGG